MSFARRPGSGSPRQTSSREDRHIVRNARVQPTASSAAIQAQVAPSLGTPISSQNIRRRLAEGHLGSWHPLHELPLTPTHRRLRLEWCCARGNWTAAEWSQVVFSDGSRFNLSSDSNRVRVWRSRGERLNPAFALQQHTAPTVGVMDVYKDEKSEFLHSRDLCDINTNINIALRIYVSIPATNCSGENRPPEKSEKLLTCRTATAGSDVVQSGRPIFDDFFQHLWPYISNNTANVVFQMVKRLWLIRIDQ
ncbi:transposable element Tcb2 transposase [Trichonephila clavipes]|nr:transposable element Tcb2 transposase [Trichonephila clavipes]